MFVALSRLAPLVPVKQSHDRRAGDETALLSGAWRETAGATDTLLRLVRAVALAGLVILCWRRNALRDAGAVCLCGSISAQRARCSDAVFPAGFSASYRAVRRRGRWETPTRQGKSPTTAVRPRWSGLNLLMWMAPVK